MVFFFGFIYIVVGIGGEYMEGRWMKILFIVMIN